MMLQAKKAEELLLFTKNEAEFERKFPDLYQKYLIFRKYYKIKTGKEVYADDYDSIIVKSLVAYFLYKGKYLRGRRRQGRYVRSKITLKEIASLLNYKSHAGSLYAIQSIKRMLKYNPDFKVINKEIKDLWISFFFIMTKN